RETRTGPHRARTRAECSSLPVSLAPAVRRQPRSRTAAGRQIPLLKTSRRTNLRRARAILRLSSSRLPTMSGAKTIKAVRGLQRLAKAIRNRKRRVVRRSGIHPRSKIGRDSKPRYGGAFFIDVRKFVLLHV